MKVQVSFSGLGFHGHSSIVSPTIKVILWPRGKRQLEEALCHTALSSMLEEREGSTDRAAVDLTSPRAGAQTYLRRADEAVGGAAVAEVTRTASVV